MLYSGWMVLFSIMYGTRSFHFYWVANGVASMAAIAFLLIQPRISLGWTTWYDGTSTTPSGPVLFRANGSATTPSSTVRVLKGYPDDNVEMQSAKPYYTAELCDEFDRRCCLGILCVFI
jgi:hypothetical protein